MEIDLLNPEVLEALSKALQNNSHLLLNGYNVDSKFTDNGFVITIKKDDTLAKTKQDFYSYLEKIDTDIFTEAMESIGNDLDKTIKCVDSQDYETVLSGINKAKIAIKNTLKNRIEQLQSEIKRYSELATL